VRRGYSPFPFPFRPRRLLSLGVDPTDEIPTIRFTFTTMSPTPVLGTISEDALAALSESSRACIERLCMHEPDRFELTNECVISSLAAGRCGVRTVTAVQ
jgi:hypothetical protein